MEPYKIKRLSDNKVIAKFMGYKMIDEYRCEQPDCGEVWMFEDMPYYSSWDWLMPVVEKIESLNNQRNGFWIYRNVVSIDNPGIKKTIGEVNGNKTKIESTYDAVILFLVYYLHLEKKPNKQ